MRKGDVIVRVGEAGRGIKGCANGRIAAEMRFVVVHLYLSLSDLTRIVHSCSSSCALGNDASSFAVAWQQLTELSDASLRQFMDPS